MRPPSRPRVRGGTERGGTARGGTARGGTARGGAAATWDEGTADDEVLDAEFVDAQFEDDAADEALDGELVEELDGDDGRDHGADGDGADGGDAGGAASAVHAADPAADRSAGESTHPRAPENSRAMVAMDPQAARSARLRAALASSRRAAHTSPPGAGPSGAAANGEALGDAVDSGESVDAAPTAAPQGATALPGASAVVSAGLAARLAQREAYERRRRLKRIGAVAAVFAALGALGWVLFLSPLFALDPEQIEVRGASEYVDVAQVSGIAAQVAGTPLPRLSTGDLAARVEALPPVGSATVMRAWPHGLVVDLTSRTPVATAADPGGVALVDGSGVVLAVVETPPDGLPELTVPLAPAESTTTEARDARETVAAVLEVLEVLPEGLRAQVASAGGSSPATVTLTLRTGATVHWGSARDAELKAAVLEVLVEQQPARVYDVSVPDRPTTS